MPENFSASDIVCEDIVLHRLVTEAKNCIANQESLCLTTSEILYWLQSIRRHVSQLTSLTWLPEREGLVEQPAEIEYILKYPEIFSGITNLDITFDIRSDWLSDRIFTNGFFSDVEALSCRLHPEEHPNTLACQFQKTSLERIKELELVFPPNRVDLSTFELTQMAREFPLLERLVFIDFQMKDEEFKKIPSVNFKYGLLEAFTCLDTVKRRYQHWSIDAGVEIGLYPPIGDDKLSLL